MTLYKFVMSDPRFHILFIESETRVVNCAACCYGCYITKGIPSQICTYLHTHKTSNSIRATLKEDK